MADLIRIKIKKGNDQFNTILLNMDNVISIEQISTRIHFSLVGGEDEIAEYDTKEEAERQFDELYDSY